MCKESLVYAYGRRAHRLLAYQPTGWHMSVVLPITDHHHTHNKCNIPNIPAISATTDCAPCSWRPKSADCLGVPTRRVPCCPVIPTTVPVSVIPCDTPPQRVARVHGQNVAHNALCCNLQQLSSAISSHSPLCFMNFRTRSFVRSFTVTMCEIKNSYWSRGTVVLVSTSASCTLVLIGFKMTVLS